MTLIRRPVPVAIRRWEASGLLTPELAERLRAEESAHSAGARRGFAQLLLATTGALVLLMATLAFFSWAWPALGEDGRTVMVAGLGLVLVAGALRVERTPQWRRPAWVAEVAGLGVLAVAVVYSENAWPQQTPGAVVAGTLALLVPLVGLPLTARRHPVLPVALTVLGYLFLFLFLRRALALPGETAIWVLDAAFLVAVAVILARLAAGRAAPWELHAAAASLYVGFVLILATATGPMELGGDAAVYPLDAWWAASTLLILWAVHRAPAGLRRDWYGGGVLAALVLGVGLAFWTTLGALELPPEAAALSVAALGVGAVVYALRFEEQALLVLAALTLVVAAWYYTAERGQALGGVVALLATAGLLFWVAGRLGAMRREPG